MISSLDKILFLDIETVPIAKHYSHLSEELQCLWNEKFDRISKRMPEKFPDESTAEWAFENAAGVYAEFGKIVCISVGFCYTENGQLHLRTKSFASDDEATILSDFFDLIERFMTTPKHSFCGHNIKEFDIPYICRRALINNLRLPDCLQIAGKKPWELNFIDTLALWKFGDYKSFTSLKTLTAVFGIPTPKDDICGADVARVYYHEQDLKRISTYCQKDVVATAQVYLRLCGEPTIQAENIEFTDI